MALPPEPPESVTLGVFNGIKNTVAEERLAPGELAAAVNVDVDDAGQLRRRRGYALVDAASYHSAITVADRHFIVRDGLLGTLDAGLNFTSLTDVGPDALSYTAVGDVVYFASRSASGKIIGNTVHPWGQTGGDGEWISPVMRPTETLGAISGQTLSRPPLASEIEYYKGRIYLGEGKWLWATELYLYDLLDKTKSFIPFEHDITMVRAVTDGLYVGTTQQLFFLSGILAKGLERTLIVDSPVIRGSAVWAPTADVHPQAKNGPVPEGNSPVFMTGDGICVGLDGGQVYNLTRGRVVFPGAERAAALYREDQGANAYIAVADSAGGPSASVRFGDYADAEIIRASQGG